MHLFWRIVRTLTNPCPGPGQAWRLDGVGPVFVQSINWGATPVTIELILPNGEGLRGWRLGQFRAQATLREHDTSPALTFNDLHLLNDNDKNKKRAGSQPATNGIGLMLDVRDNA